ncbi:uncharacterized protein LOC131840783 [Achroia grisella]|uniref:uncharacterized protein LOC131840783 n=1 Tax=Achroia grisella TaxID=688607 RepID=UPI0027D24FAA|nr:uncharacterized protein LOC131840783 [Achroia grisella]
MTLIGAILKKAKSKECVSKKYSSPPPELEEAVLMKKKKKVLVDKFAHVRAVVDSTPPRYSPALMMRALPHYHHQLLQIYRQNIQLLIAIKRTHFTRGKVDCRWNEPPCAATNQNYKNRVQFLNRVQTENQNIYKRIVNAEARVSSTASLRREWGRNRRQILRRAQAPFVLFPPVPQQIIEDAVFIAPTGIKRPRVYLSLRMRNYAALGELTVELFTEVCPRTCELFLTLLHGDGLGHGYVGTCFFRKVPNLYWRGGDVICNNGYGCYAQRGRTMPVGAENYHFPHSMPGLLSMRVTRDDEVCGVFSITFKPLPQFDLKNVVFGRIIRPCNVYEAIRELGSPLSVQPVIELTAARRRVGRRWVYGQPNTRI